MRRRGPRKRISARQRLWLAAKRSLNMRKVVYIILVALGAYLLTGIAQVRPGERAVVRRFGRVVAQPLPGLWIGLPWGMDRVDRVPVSFVRRAYIGYDPEADDNSFMP